MSECFGGQRSTKAGKQSHVPLQVKCLVGLELSALATTQANPRDYTGLCSGTGGVAGNSCGHRPVVRLACISNFWYRVSAANEKEVITKPTQKCQG
jgi:hypothetical protein